MVISSYLNSIVECWMLIAKHCVLMVYIQEFDKKVQTWNKNEDDENNETKMS